MSTFQAGKYIFILLLCVFLLFSLSSTFLNFFKPFSPVIHFFDIGQGDSHLAEIAPGIQVLFDGGPDQHILEELEEVMVQDREIEVIIISHPQIDHFGGLLHVLKRYQVGVILLSGVRASDVLEWVELEKLAMRKNIPMIPLRPGSLMRIGQSKFYFVYPASEYFASADLNDASLVTYLVHPDFTALFTGDIHERGEKYLAKRYDLRADILKVAHHGSRFSSSFEFLSELKPQIAVIQSGKGNRYGHPAPEVIERLYKASPGVDIFRNDESGRISIWPEGGGRFRVREEQ